MAQGEVAGLRIGKWSASPFTTPKSLECAVRGSNRQGPFAQTQPKPSPAKSPMNPKPAMATSKVAQGEAEHPVSAQAPTQIASSKLEHCFLRTDLFNQSCIERLPAHASLVVRPVRPLVWLVAIESMGSRSKFLLIQRLQLNDFVARDALR
jgi:hypothetical protein